MPNMAKRRCGRMNVRGCAEFKQTCQKTVHGASSDSIPKRSHGESRRTPEYLCYRNMLARCRNPNHPSYPNYGGRGIVVCQRWQESYANFIADMGRRPSNGHTIERRDNNLGYSPDNCVWADRLRQSNNTRLTTRLTYNGETKSLHEWGVVTGLPRSLIYQRLKSGWSPERIFTTAPSAVHSANGRLANDKSHIATRDAEREAKRHRPVIGLRGERNPRHKLTADQVDEIRLLKGIESSHLVGPRYGVSKTVILNIWRGKSWKMTQTRQEDFERAIG